MVMEADVVGRTPMVMDTDVVGRMPDFGMNQYNQYVLYTASVQDIDQCPIFPIKDLSSQTAWDLTYENNGSQLGTVNFAPNQRI